MGFFSALVGGVVGFFVGGPVGAVIGAGLGATKVGEKVVNTVLDFVTQPFMPKIPEVGVSGDEAKRQEGVLVQTQGSTVNIPVVYGFRKVGGAVVFAETGSTTNKYLYVAYVFSEGVVEGLREVFIDDWLLPVDQVGQLNGGSLVTVNADRYKDLVQMRWYPGTYFSNPRSSTIGSTVKGDIFKEAPSFTTDMNFNGLAVLFCRFEWKQTNDNSNPFGGSIPQVQISMLGKRVASLLVNDTEAVAYDQNAIRYSTNPAECLLDYLRNPRYGKGLANSDIDWTTWKWAARKCNQTVTYVASGITGPILTLNYVVNTSSTIMSNTKDMLTNFRAYMPYVQGKYKLKIEDAGNDTDILSGAATIVQTFTKDDIVSDITYNGIDRSSKYNVVAVTYVDPDQKFSNQTVVYPETESERQVYINRDGGRENKYDTTLGGITNYAIAKDMARLIFNKQRRQESCVFTATSKALELEPGDCVRIQSNLLNFGTDPWRVVSIKINNDMTVDLGCVRNPDDIYPYVRVGEEDIVLPTYVPKGSIVYFPGSANETPLGLVPPINAVFPTVVVPTPVSPAPTNPNTPAGGGVGGGTTNSGATGTTTTPTPGTNNNPVAPPPPPPFDATLTLRKVVATDLGNQTVAFNLTFTQPTDALYQKSMFWWRLNKNSPWTAIDITDKPGAGGDITISITGLPSVVFTPYSFYARCYASDGRVSRFVTNGTFQVAQNQSTGAIVGAGSGTTTQVADGWAPPASEVSTTPVYNDIIDYLAIKPRLGQDPRRLKVEIQQLQNTISSSINTLIKGFSVYYRFKGDTYWTREAFTYPSNYVMGLLTFNLAGDFGALGTLGALQQYEFFVMLDYSDGKRAEKYLQPVAAPVQVDGLGNTDYTIYGTRAITTSATVKSVDIPASFSFLTTDQDPNNSFAQGSDIVPVLTVTAGISNNTLTFLFSPPTNSKFRGYKIRYREVIPGADPDFTTIDIGPSSNTNDGSGRISYTLLAANYIHGKAYEWVITAKYSASGTITDATYSLYGKATVPAGDYNWQSVDIYSRIFTGTQPIATTLAVGNIQASFPALPTVNPKSWIKKQTQSYSAIGSAFGNGQLGRDIYYAGTGFYYLNAYYQLKFQADSSSNNLVIYRRVYDFNGLQKTTTTNVAKYNGLGAWEKTVVALSSIPADGDGWRTVNVRGPIDPSLFDPYYGVTGYSTRTLYNATPGFATKTFPYTGASPTTTNIYPYYGVGNTAVSSARTKYAEFVFVLATGATEQTKGLRLTEFYAADSGTGFKTEVDGFQGANVPKTDVVTLSDFDTNVDAGFGRRISEAITSLTFNNLHKGSWYYGGFGVPQYPTSGGGYSYYLRQPTDGNTVY